MLKSRLSALLTACILVFAQAAHSQLAIGQWREHFSYRNGISVSQGGGKIYCVSKGGIFSYKLSDNSIERMSKITGLSDVEPIAAEYNNYNQSLLILYKNANIDLVKNGKVINISDIKRKTLVGNKTINSVLFQNQYAYLACGFGIVVLDTEKEEIKETYYIGTNGKAVNVYELTTDGTSYFAATNDGIYQAAVNNPNLIDYNSWIRHGGLPTGVFNTITVFDGNIYTNFSKNITSGSYLEDTVYLYNGTQWIATNLGKDNVKKISGFPESLVVTNEWYVNVFDKSLTMKMFISDYGFSKDNRPKDAFIDGNNILWIADNDWGLVKSYSDGVAEYFLPNGPYTNGAYDMKVSGGHLWVAPNSKEGYTVDGLYHYNDNTWTNITRKTIKQLDTVYNLNVVEIDPDDPNHIFAGSFGTGLLEVTNNAVTALHNSANTGGGLENIQGFPGYYNVRVVGLDYDEDKNLWASLSNVTKCLTVKKKAGGWQNFDFSAFISPSNMERLLVTKWNQKWMTISNGGGVLVYNDDGNFLQPNASNTKRLNANKGNGGLPSNDITTMMEDQDGEIWIGTNKGIAVFYTPESIFTGTGWDAQQILIEQDGHVQILFETEVITSISIDGANRKWIGTQNSGAFLMSEDGTKQIQHFTVDNSPLPANDITSIAIDHLTGEVFFGTAKGIVSYRSDATEGLDDYKDVYAFPNPVRETYQGPIAIRGLAKNANVKITDITGTLVYETKALGGQAIWEGKTFGGERVKTGVYLVFCSNDDGTKTHVTKILVIN